MIKYLILIVLIANALAKTIKTCPACPTCQVCDTKKARCFPAPEFSSCKAGKLNGVCYLGQCNTQLKLPAGPLPVCKTYNCIGNTCTLVPAVDGTDCTPLNAPMHSVCLNSICTPIMDGLNKAGQNMGCWLVKDNTLCDTNGIFTDGEVCFNNVCTRPGVVTVGTPLPTGSCAIVGSECLGLNTVVTKLPFHFYCLQNGLNKECVPFVDGLTTTLPIYNSGCEFMKDGTNCDTNLNPLDGEKCLVGICRFPDGTFAGQLKPLV